MEGMLNRRRNREEESKCLYEDCRIGKFSQIFKQKEMQIWQRIGRARADFRGRGDEVL